MKSNQLYAFPPHHAIKFNCERRGRLLDEEEDAKAKFEYRLGQPLDELSVDELQKLASELRLEIERLERTAKEKSEHLSAADSLFKK